MRPETEAAIRAAAIAQALADSRIGADAVTSKGGIDLVTGADMACEDAIRTELVRAFPEYPVIGEERGGKPSDGAPYWLVDPICGTRTYAFDIPLYCANIALVEDGVVTAAAIGIGRSGEILHAERGAGAFARDAAGERRVTAGDGSSALWCDGKTARAADVVRRAILARRWQVSMFPSSIAYAYVAMGRLAGILHFKPSPPAEHGSVHTAAGCLVASEAGALVTDADTGRPWGLHTTAFVLAATPELHRDLLELVEASS